jgi:hypothetical protein
LCIDDIQISLGNNKIISVISGHDRAVISSEFSVQNSLIHIIILFALDDDP